MNEENTETGAHPDGLSLKWPFIVGSLFLLLILGIVVFGDDPTPAQFVIYRIIIALAGAGFAVSLTGHLQIQFPIFRNGYIRATAGFAVFVILFFFTPASLAVDAGEIEAKRLIDQYEFQNSEIVKARQALGANWELTSDGLQDLAKSASNPNQVTLENARKAIKEFFDEAGSSKAFTVIVGSHLRIFDCVSDGRCNKNVICSGMFREIEGFRNLFCEQIIDSGNQLANSLWSRYKYFSHYTCRQNFISYYISSKNFDDMENLRDVCLPVQCWALNTKPPYPCQLRQQLIGGILAPAKAEALAKMSIQFPSL